MCESYNLPDMISKRKTEFGRGDKYDFTKVSKGKCDKFYYIKTDFDSTFEKSPKWSIGLGRDSFNKVYYETEKSFDKDVPGPAKYDFIKPLGSDSPKYSFKGRCEYKLDKNIVPGPGQYPVKVQINPEGKFPVSNIKNVTKIFISAKKADQEKCEDFI
jgi:hypothetical protein